MDTWINNDKATARTLLREMGISEDKLTAMEPQLEATKQFEKEAQGKRKEGKKQRIEALAARLQDVDTAKQAAQEWAAEVGIDSTEFVDKLTNAQDAEHVAQIVKNTVEVLNAFARLCW